MNKKIIIIGNPIAGGGALKRIKRAVNILEKRGFDVKLMLTSKKGDAEDFARQISIEQQSSNKAVEHKKLSDSESLLATAGPPLLIIAAGGDGTYNEVANGLVYSNIPMAILPLGTTSVLAKELKISDDIENALNIAINGEVETVHLGKITCSKHMRQTHGSSILSCHFLLMAGIGFDGETVYGVNEKIKRYSGKGAYILSGIKTLLKYKPSEIIIKSQNSKLIGYNAIIGKASCYGGDFKITPDAKLTEPYFYVFVMHKKDRLNLIKCISRIITKNHLEIKDISYFRASEIEIEGNAHIQIDGDYLGVTPAKIEISANALRLVRG